MSDLIDHVATIVRLNGGEIVGKTRLQKTFYLLEAGGLGFGLDFDYHNYGPFSAELAFAADDAEDLGYLETEERYGFHSVPYIIFRASKEESISPEVEFLDARRRALGVMSKYSSLVLELTATAVFLRQNGYPNTYWEEVRTRKPLKATAERVRQAQKLMEELGI